MKKSNNEAEKHDLETQPESASENEESDSITDQSSSMSENAAQRHRGTRKTTSMSAPATQFSVQRSDVDGLRMKISAIRPSVQSGNGTPYSSSNDLKQHKESTTANLLNEKKIKYNNNHHHSHHHHHHKLVETFKKLNNKSLEKQETKEKVESNEPTTTTSESTTTAMRSLEVVASSSSTIVVTKPDIDTSASHKLTTLSTNSSSSSSSTTSSASTTATTVATNSVAGNDAETVLPPLTSLMPLSTLLCLSDVTESGCSEATATTIATTTATSGNAKKATKKVKVKRKKVLTKPNLDSTKLSKNSDIQATVSTDSEDDVPLKQHIQNKQQQQRAPRLLLTAISSKNSGSETPLVPQHQQIKTLNSLAITATHVSDKIGISSSDNELPDLVSAAIKRVESGGDDDDYDNGTDDTARGSFHRKTKSKKRPQYQSTLLQDFMEKTQMLGQTPHPKSSIERSKSNKAATRAEQLQLSSNFQNSNSNSAAESNVDNSTIATKKRRGRPKKQQTSTGATITTAANVATAATNINESADSGVISTTSTTQSTSPSPNLPTAAAIEVTVTSTTNTTTTSAPSSVKQRKTDAVENSSSDIASPAKSAHENSPTKHKIDMAYLDKRMYATERVLYPPPRNKRRQSTTTKNATTNTTQKNTPKSTAVVSAITSKITKEEVLLDPAWRKIDVNKKFRRPSVSGYKSDGGGGNTTICSKILAAQSGYVSDYGSVHTRSHHHSGYKSDASCKSRYSTKSCASRRSRAKSCGYRSDCKENGGRALKSAAKFRRKRRCSLIKTHSKSVGNLNDEQEILQLAGLTLGQSSEESSEYVCKPRFEQLPTTSVSKKYGEINRFIATGEYFGRGTSTTFSSLTAAKRQRDDDLSQDDGFGGTSLSGKLLLERKNSLLPLNTPRKIKSRRSSAASYCSSYYSGTSRIRRRRRRKSFRFPANNKATAVDSKLLTEIEILSSSFGSLCRIYGATITTTPPTTTTTTEKLSSNKEKLLAEANKLQSLSASSSAAGKRESRVDKRTLKKRKISENLDFALLSAAAAAGGVGGLTPNSSGGGSTKRRHKKATSSSPDDHKLPLKKRHYLLTPGEKSTEAAVAVRAKLFASSAEAWAAAAAVAKTTASTKSQQQFSAAKTAAISKAGLTPKKRHLLQSAAEVTVSSIKGSNSSPLRIVIEPSTSGLNSSKLLDVSPLSTSSSKHNNNNNNNNEQLTHKKRTRLEGLVCKMVTNHTTEEPEKELNKKCLLLSAPQVDSETSCPPPGVFEPSVALEIQIPPIAKLTEAAAAIITKSEVDSPLLMDLNRGFASVTTKIEGNRVVEALLNKTGGNLLLKRKRKKINRTGFPTVRRKKRKIHEHLLLDVTPDISEEAQRVAAQAQAAAVAAANKKAKKPAENNVCDRVPQAGETSDVFLERANRTPRLSVVSLERLQSTPVPTSTGKKNKIEKITSRNKQEAKQPDKKLQKQKKQQKEPLQQHSDTLKTKTATKAESKVDETAAASTKTSMLNNKEKTAAVKEEQCAVNSTKRARGRKIKAFITPKTPQPVENCVPKTEKIATNTQIKRHKMEQRERETKTTFSKSTVQKIITGKTLENKVKIPAATIDANSKFNCKNVKIRLKRRSILHPIVPAAPSIVAADVDDINSADATAEAAEKETLSMLLEHDVLPLCEATSNGLLDSEAASDTGDEKSSTTSIATTTTATTTATTKKMVRLKKTYLPAGLFSDYFKLPPPDASFASAKSTTAAQKKKDAAASSSNPDGNLQTSLLPPPPYCERYFRRTERDFELPYDIWWAYTNSKLPTRFTVPSWNYRKIRVNVYADAVRPNTAGLDHPTCNCKPDVGCADHCLNRMVYTECSPSSCPTRDKCLNQKIQRHEVAPGVERFMTTDKGWGVRTKLPIEKGTYILEYVGEVVTEREFKDRMGTIYLNDIHHYCLNLDGGLVIDGHRMGSDGRFVNHSCFPNCEIQKWSVNGLSRMALFAKREIEVGEELTYDYNFSLFNPSEGQPCRCNMPQCRGVIGGKSQRIKPLPLEVKPIEAPSKDTRNGHQRKRKAKKIAQCVQPKDVVVAARLQQQLTEKERRSIKQSGVFLVRNFEKIRRCKAAKRKLNSNNSKPQTPTSAPSTPVNVTPNVTPATINKRRPSTPSSLAVQISALCSPRNIKTRGLTLAVQDPEVEKMAKMAVILRDICVALETLPDPNDPNLLILTKALSGVSGVGNKKKKALKNALKREIFDLKTVQENIEQGYYKQPFDFDNDMQKIFDEARQAHNDDDTKLQALITLTAAYEREKRKIYTQILDLVGDEAALESFRPIKVLLETKSSTETGNDGDSAIASNNVEASIATPTKPNVAAPATTDAKASKTQITTTEDIIRCICGLYKDEGLMIQCARCMVWQHTECTKADVDAENYLCERCEPRVVSREIPLDDYTEDGNRYFLSLMRGTLHVRQGDAVYVLRDIPMRDNAGNVMPAMKHTYETIGQIDYNECDIFRVERLWKNESANKRYIFGHHFLRPHETFHEPSRRFYPNEVVRVPLYEVVPIELVIGRCWVLDRTTFCKGRPMECDAASEEHCYICELRVDKTARFFSKAKVNYPTCTKNYAFRKFSEKLKIAKTYAPHELDPSKLKTKKPKTDNEIATCETRQDTNKMPQSGRGKRQSVCNTSSSSSPTTVNQIYTPITPAVQVIKEKRARLETVLKAMKLLNKPYNTPLHSAHPAPPIDLSYLLTGRGARQRKTLNTKKSKSSAVTAALALSAIVHV